jgi:hypothetical protein
MSVSANSKIDLLYKQAFGVTKTDTETNKGPSNEAIASSIVVRSENVWSLSGSIPGVAAAVAGVVTSYTGASAVQCTADNTTVPVSSVYPTWKTNLTNWIPSEYGSTYTVEVWVDSSGVANPTSTGTQIYAAGSGGTGEFYFNYGSGVLNFIGGTIPAALTSGKVIYVVGYRYVGGSYANVATFGNTTITGFANIQGNAAVSGTISGNNLTLSGNLTVSGNITYINTTTLNVGDNIITLNADVTGAPSENAGIEINRGTSANVFFRWNESSDKWEYTNDGTNFNELSASGGYTGSVGYTGSQGTNGYNGSLGYTGSKGDLGYTGSKGDTGYNGSFGATGYTGSKGDTGYDGSFGATGYTGSKGDTGYNGSFGTTGYTGSKGDTGYNGSFGATGYTGSQGATGYTGSKGDLGYTGSQGTSGYDGSFGATGYTGSQGATGYTGSGFANGQSIQVANLQISNSLIANSTPGSNGQILFSNGLSVYWADLIDGGTY